MVEIALASINSFAHVAQQADVSPEEHIFVLTSSQLQEIIERAIQPFKDGVRDLKDIVANLEAKVSALEGTQDAQADNELNMLRLINDIRTRDPRKTEISRAEKITKYLEARPDHKASFETLKGHLGVDKNRLKEAIRTLIASSPGRYSVTRPLGDKRKRILVMLPK